MSHKKYVLEGKADHEDVGRYVINFVNVAPPNASGPFANTRAEIIDEHYVLFVTLAGNPSRKLFGVVDIDEPKEADRRLYEKAKELASDSPLEDRTRHARTQPSPTAQIS